MHTFKYDRTKMTNINSFMHYGHNIASICNEIYKYILYICAAIIENVLVNASKYVYCYKQIYVKSE